MNPPVMIALMMLVEICRVAHVAAAKQPEHQRQLRLSDRAYIHLQDKFSGAEVMNGDRANVDLSKLKCVQDDS